MEWTTYQISDVCTINKKGVTPKEGVCYALYSLPAFDKSKKPEIVYGQEIKSNKFSIQNNTILFNKLNVRFKRVWNIKELKHSNNICSTEFFPLSVKGDVEQDFLYYYLISDHITEVLKKSLSGTSSSHQRIDLNLFLQLPINLPSISDQRKIAGILSALDSKIENNNRINANLESQAQALFKSWFVDFTPFKDQPFVDSELGPIPQGWKVGKLGDYCETICRGLTPKYNLDSKEIVLGQTCVRNNIVTLNNARKHQPKGKTEKKVQQWDTLINSTGIGSLGRVGIVYFDYNYVSFDSHITVVRATNPLQRPYIGRNLVSRQLEIENLAIGSTGQTELPRESVKSITLYIPTQKVLESFNCIIKPLSLKILKNIQENQRLAALRDTLLPKLMSGEIKL